MTKLDRELWGNELGSYYMCAQSYDSFSAYATVLDEVRVLEVTHFTGEKQTMYNFWMHAQSGVQLKFTESELYTEDLEIPFTATVYSSKEGDNKDIKIFYRVCVYGDCKLTPEEAAGIGQVEVASLTKTVTYLGDTSAKNALS